jgi:hypothetical protein
MSVIHRVNGEDIRSLHNSQTALLWRLIRRACKCGCGQLRRTWGQVSITFVLQSEQVMVGYLKGQKRCLRALPIY